MYLPSLRRYCAPFALFLLLFACIDPLLHLGVSNSKYVIFPLQALLCGALVFLWRREYSLARPQGAALSVGIALLTFGLWISPQALFGMPPRLEGFNPEGSPAYWATVLLRFVRLVVVVPLVEEIFWRGFLLRYLIREDFTSVPFGTFTWRSFGAVTLLFALEHQPADYPAALLTGALYNLLAVRTRSLSACILAHAITNLLLGVYVMATRQWGFW
ncbi:MAG: CAAX prenyl protease-related protein [Verrucomicrobiota bacterium]